MARAYLHHGDDCQPVLHSALRLLAVHPKQVVRGHVPVAEGAAQTGAPEGADKRTKHRVTQHFMGHREATEQVDTG